MIPAVTISLGVVARPSWEFGRALINPADARFGPIAERLLRAEPARKTTIDPAIGSALGISSPMTEGRISNTSCQIVMRPAAARVRNLQ